MAESNRSSWDGWTGRRLLQELAPDVGAVLVSLGVTTPIELGLTGDIRRTCAATLGIVGLAAPADGDSPAAAPAVVEMARQFATDVSAVDDSLRGRFATACGRSVFETTQAMYVADFAPRVTAALDALAGSSEPWPDGGPDPVEGGTYWAAIEGFLREVHRLEGLDPVLSEVIRLRGARQHNCRLCRSIRSRPALVAGATDDLFDAIDDDGWAGLPEASRAALGLTDAMIWHPGSIPEALVADVRRHFTPAEAVEVVLDVMHNAANKIAVALAADAPNVEDGFEVYEIDPDGVAHYGLAAP
jgi:alkylhydroperoxidase family enzyme